MNGQGKDARARERGGDFPVLNAAEVVAKRNKGDLIVDLSGIMELSLIDLAILLTAQQRAEREDRDVWLAGIPLHVWQGLSAMGLGNLFRPFPVYREAAD